MTPRIDVELGGDPRPRRVPAVAERLTERAFRVLARTRRARALHPRGVTLRGTATVDPASGLAGSAPAAAVVRLSWGAGLPRPLPDVHGVAIRLEGAHGPGRHQDLLVSATFSAPVLRHVLRPSRRLDHGGCTSLLPHRHLGQRVLFRVPRVPVPDLEQVAASLPMDLTVERAGILGPWRPVGSIRLTEVVADDEAVRFDPWTTGDDLVPAGFLNALRRPAYRGSRSGHP